MMKASKWSRASTPQRTAAVVGLGALVLWFVFIGTFLQYAGTRPHSPQPDAGRIYAINNHGTVTYLDGSERRRLSTLERSAGGMFLIAVLLSIWPKPKRPAESV